MKRLELFKEMEKELKYARFVHTVGVSTTAVCMAMKFGCNLEKAETAGLLHDCAKYMSLDKMNTICKKAGLPISEMEASSTALLHSKAGSVYANTKYGIDDPEILDAIRYHTTGRPGMTLLDKIIFIADYIEPGRDQAPDLPEVRALAFEDVDKCLLKILEDTLEYLQSTGKKTDPMTQKTYNYYKQQFSE